LSGDLFELLVQRRDRSAALHERLAARLPAADSAVAAARAGARDGAAACREAVLWATPSA